jgi:hypothetical protein
MSLKSQKDLALYYASKNVPVFPCSSPWTGGKNKAPLVAGGFLSATTDRGKIEEWWTKWPHAYVAGPTGERMGRWVLDIDNLKEFEGLEYPDLPSTYTVRTPSGGLHYYFTFPGDITTSPGSLTKKSESGENILDIRGNGGYVILPRNPGYDLINKSHVASTPSWLERRLKSPRRASVGTGKVKTLSHSFKPLEANFDLSLYYSGDIIHEGSRNETLFDLALDIRAANEGIPVELLGSILFEVNREYCSPPLGEEEVKTITSSSMNYNKRVVPEECLKMAAFLHRVAMNCFKGGVGDVLSAAAYFLSKYGKLDDEGNPSFIKDVRTIAEEAAVGRMNVSDSLKTFREHGVKTERYEDIFGKPFKWSFPSSVFSELVDGNSSAPETDKRHFKVVVLPLVRSGRSGDKLQCHPLFKAYEKVQSFRNKGLIGKVEGHVLRYIAYKEFSEGGTDKEDLLTWIGYSRKRDAIKKVIQPLLEKGLIEEKCGSYRLHRDYEKNLQIILDTPYSEERVKIKRIRDSVSGRKVSVAVSNPSLNLSENQRNDFQRVMHANERKAYYALIARSLRRKEMRLGKHRSGTHRENIVRVAA